MNLFKLKARFNFQPNRLLLASVVWVVCALVMYGFWFLLLPEKWEIVYPDTIVGSKFTPSYSILALWLLLALLVIGATRLFGKINLLPLSFVYPILYGIYGFGAERKIFASTLEEYSPRERFLRLNNPDDYSVNWSIETALFIMLPICILTVIFLQKFILDKDNHRKNVIHLRYLALIFGVMGLFTLILGQNYIMAVYPENPIGDDGDPVWWPSIYRNQTTTYYSWILFIFCVVKLRKHSIPTNWLYTGFFIFGLWEIAFIDLLGITPDTLNFIPYQYTLYAYALHQVLIICFAIFQIFIARKICQKVKLIGKPVSIISNKMNAIGADIAKYFREWRGRKYKFKLS